MSDQDGRNKSKSRQEQDNGDEFQPQEPYFPTQPPEDLYDDPFASVQLDDGTEDDASSDTLHESGTRFDDDGIPVLDEWVDANDVPAPADDRASSAGETNADDETDPTADTTDAMDTAAEGTGAASRGNTLDPLITDMASELRRELGAVQGYEGSSGQADTGGSLREEMMRTAALEPLLNQIANRLQQELRLRLEEVVREAIEQALEDALERHAATLQQRIADRLRGMIPEVVDSVFGASRDSGR